jgi:hypothetical protein
MFELHKETVIEATPALEALLAHSDIDLALPMSMVVPPFAAQYLRFGPEAARLLPQPMLENPDVVFDGVFCFLSAQSKDAAGIERGGWLELIFIGKGCDRFDGHVSLTGWIDRGYATFNDWVRECMANSGVEPSRGPEDMRSFVSYVVKVFLYLTLKDARRVAHSEASKKDGIALRRYCGRPRHAEFARWQRNAVVLRPSAALAPWPFSHAASRSSQPTAQADFRCALTGARRPHDRRDTSSACLYGVSVIKYGLESEE